MKADNIFKHIQIDAYALTPKYIQLSNSIIQAIEKGLIEKGYLLPSINDLSYELDVSRDTAEKTYRNLKHLGVVGSVPGKGYFISKIDFKHPLKILLVFNKLSAHKKIVYDTFSNTLGQQAALDFYIYNNDLSLFKKILLKRKENYTHYVIIPHFLGMDGGVADIINEIPDGKLIILDKLINGIKRDYAAVYENFEKDIFKALSEALPQLEKYTTLKIVFPSNTYYPEEILKGFQSFCLQFAFNYNRVENIELENIKRGEAYIILMEDDLLILLEKVQATNLKIGKEIGIISYNETPWKQFILNGITTISTDFKKMGELAAQMVLTNNFEHIEVPFSLTLRKSL